VAATVTNLGIVTETFDVMATVNGYADTVGVADLSADSSVQVVFSDWQVPPADSTTYTVRVCTALPTDADTSNDCSTKDVFARAAVYDCGVIAIGAPPDTVVPDSQYVVVATVRNFGMFKQSFDVVASIDGYSDTVSVDSLAPGAQTQRTFANWTVPPTDSTEYTMVVCTELLGDIDSTNDCAQKAIFARYPVGVMEELRRATALTAFTLDQNDPNPFCASTTIKYSIPTSPTVTLEVFDITGRLVEALVNETQQPGIHQVNWNRDTNPSGVYFYRLKAGEFTETKMMIIMH
jgi:hypothetical protein